MERACGASPGRYRLREPTIVARREYDRNGSGAYLCDEASKSSSLANERGGGTGVATPVINISYSFGGGTTKDVPWGDCALVVILIEMIEGVEIYVYTAYAIVTGASK